MFTPSCSFLIREGAEKEYFPPEIKYAFRNRKKIEQKLKELYKFYRSWNFDSKPSVQNNPDKYNSKMIERNSRERDLAREIYKMCGRVGGMYSYSLGKSIISQGYSMRGWNEDDMKYLSEEKFTDAFKEVMFRSTRKCDHCGKSVFNGAPISYPVELDESDDDYYEFDFEESHYCIACYIGCDEIKGAL